MKTGTEYRTSLNDGRETYFEGAPDLRSARPSDTRSVRGIVARGYDRCYAPGEAARNPLMKIPRSAEELRERIPCCTSADIVARVTYQSMMTLLTAAGRIEAGASALRRPYPRVREGCAARDVRITQCITDAKGDRSRRPGLQDDPDAYMRVVKRTQRRHRHPRSQAAHPGASMGHELMTIPTKSMKADEADYSVACAVPVNAPGVKIVNTTYAPRHEDKRDFPMSGQLTRRKGSSYSTTCSCRTSASSSAARSPNAAVFAHSLGLWERLGGLSEWRAVRSLVGFAQLIAEANGLTSVAHIKEKISEIMINATLIRASLDAAINNCRSRRTARRSRASCTRTSASTTGPPTTP